MAEYVANAEQIILLNNPAIFDTSIPCNTHPRIILHDNQTGIFILRGIVGSPYIPFARYQVAFNGNIAIPTGGAVTPIAVALTVNGEPRPTSRAIYTPAAVDTYGNVTSTALITVPRGADFTVSLRYVAGTDDPAVTPTPAIQMQNGNLVITRIA